MNERPTPETDQFKIKLKTTCGEKYWVPVEHSERLELERDEAREDAAHWKTEYEIVVDRLRGRKHPRDNGIIADDEIIPKLERERDEALEAVRLASIEAKALATSIQKSEYSDVKFELCDSVAGVISQIDNMYAGVREQRDEAIRLLKLYVPIMRLQHIKKKLKNF